MELVLVRHGRIAGKPMRPRDDDPLSELGRTQAQRTAERLVQDPPYAAIVCSPLRRARETAGIIGAHLQLEPVIVDALTEMVDVELRWLLLAETAARLPFMRHRLRLRPGEISRWPLVGRVGGAIAQLVAEHTEQRVIVVAHGGVIWGTLTHYFPEGPHRFARGPVANGSITRIEIKPDGAHLIVRNDVTHLDGLLTY